MFRHAHSTLQRFGSSSIVPDTAPAPFNNPSFPMPIVPATGAWPVPATTAPSLELRVLFAAMSISCATTMMPPVPVVTCPTPADPMMSCGAVTLPPVTERLPVECAATPSAMSLVVPVRLSEPPVSL